MLIIEDIYKYRKEYSEENYFNSLKNYKSFHYDGNIIFGATAKIINNLLNILNKQS